MWANCLLTASKWKAPRPRTPISDDAICKLTEDGIHPTDYRNTAHYQLTKRFLDDPERMLSYLFEEKENS